MEDREIMQLLTQRNPEAVRCLSQKFDPYCRQIAKNILGSEQDVEECLNDTYLQVWNAIPPANPENLGAYVATITRNLAFNRLRKDRAERRGGGNIPLVLSELADVVSTYPSPEEILSAKELTQAINDFLAALSKQDRYMFIRRYYYADSVYAIARRAHRTQASVSMKLTRIRRKLHDHLTERGFNP